MNKTITIIIIALVVVVGGYFLLRKGYQVPNVSEEPAGQKIDMVSGNLFFTPKNITLKKDQPVKITFQNTGTHTFTIDELGVNEPLRGSSAVVEFTPTRAGTFEYYCAIPGHREGGMFGTLIVE